MRKDASPEWQGGTPSRVELSSSSACFRFTDDSASYDDLPPVDPGDDGLALYRGKYSLRSRIGY